MKTKTLKELYKYVLQTNHKEVVKKQWNIVTLNSGEEILITK